MSSGEADLAEQLVDEAALAAYLEEHLGPHEGDYEVTRHTQGHSNETFFVTWAGDEMVLRRPPLGDLLPTAHDVLREHTVLSALEGTDAPTPDTVLACDDEEVLGKPFYLMEKVEGHVIRDEVPDTFDAPEHRERIGEELVDALADIHNVDVDAVGLRDWAPGEGYLERQVERWTQQLNLTQPNTEDVRDVPELRDVAAWLDEHVPETPTITLVQGDYKLDNVVYAPDPPPDLQAVLDWEMATLGDPLADLGWMLSFWFEPDDEMEDLLSIYPTFTAREGFPSRADLVERYENRTGVTVRNLTWYRVLAVFKLATLLEGSFARHLAGTTDDPFFEEMEWAVPALADHAVRMAGEADA